MAAGSQASSGTWTPVRALIASATAWISGRSRGVEPRDHPGGGVRDGDEGLADRLGQAAQQGDDALLQQPRHQPLAALGGDLIDQRQGHHQGHPVGRRARGRSGTPGAGRVAPTCRLSGKRSRGDRPRPPWRIRSAMRMCSSLGSRAGRLAQPLARTGPWSRSPPGPARRRRRRSPPRPPGCRGGGTWSPGAGRSRSAPGCGARRGRGSRSPPRPGPKRRKTSRASAGLMGP